MRGRTSDHLQMWGTIWVFGSAVNASPSTSHSGFSHSWRSSSRSSPAVFLLPGPSRLLARPGVSIATLSVLPFAQMLAQDVAGRLGSCLRWRRARENASAWRVVARAGAAVDRACLAGRPGAHRLAAQPPDEDRPTGR